MSHVSESVLVDLADGAVAEASVPHLAGCEECRGRLADLRAMMVAVAAVDVPEPSPLFWDHLAARVHEAIDAEPLPPVSQRARWFSWKVLAPIAACAVVLVVVGLRYQPAPVAPASPAAVADSGHDMPDVQSDDPSWSLITELAADLDWDTAVDAGMAPAGGVDRAVFELNADERRELQRLLQEELSRSGVKRIS